MARLSTVHKEQWAAWTEQRGVKRPVGREVGEHPNPGPIQEKTKHHCPPTLPAACSLLLEPLEPRWHLSALDGTAFQDLNRNGLLEDGEPGVAGVSVELFRTSSLKPDASLREDQVLVIYNSQNSDSLAVFNHYRSRRPGVRGFDLNDPRVEPGDIGYSGFETRIRDPIRMHLEDHDLADRVVVFVLTKGLPHRIRSITTPGALGDDPVKAGAQFDAANATYASVDSELTLLWQDLRTRPFFGDHGGPMDSFADNTILNPYYQQRRTITRHSRTRIEARLDFKNRFNRGWSWRSGGSGTKASDAGRMYLTTRLDGESVEDVLVMIDRSQNPVYDPRRDQIIVDKAAGPDTQTGDYAATRKLLEDAWPALEYNGGIRFLIGSTGTVPDPNASAIGGPVAVLTSHGGNHSDASQQGYVRTFEGQLVDGAIMNTLESFNGRSFGSVGGFADQGQLSEWIESGGTFGIGTVWEPFSPSLAENEPLLDNFFFNGLTWVEAAWSSIPHLSWQHVVVGDPLAVASFNVAESSTDAAGRYGFENISSGSYYVLFTTPVDYRLGEQPPGTQISVDVGSDTETIKTEVFEIRSKRTKRDVGTYQEADTPILTAMNAEGFEDASITLDISAALTDPDGSETLAVVFTGVPAGAVLSAGRDDGEGTWVLSQEQLTNLKFTPPPDRDGPIIMMVSAIATEPAGGDSAATNETIGISVAGIADAPNLAVMDTAVKKNDAAPLNIDLTLADTDGSESISLIVEGMPDDAFLSAGKDNLDGTWVLEPDDLADLTFTDAADGDQDVFLSVTATSTETDGGGTASTRADLQVTFFWVHTLTGAVEDRDLTIDYQQLLEGAAAAGVAGEVQLVLESVESGTLTVNGERISAPGASGIVIPGDESLNWLPDANANGTMAAFTLRANGAERSAAVRFEVVVDPVNDPPVIGSLLAGRDIVGISDTLQLTADAVMDVDDTDLGVYFYLDLNDNGLVDGSDLLLAAADMSSNFSVDISTDTFSPGPLRLLAEAVDAEVAASAAVGTSVFLTEVNGGPAQQDPLSTKRKTIADPFSTFGASKPASVTLSGPGTVEVLVARPDGQEQVRHIIVRQSSTSSSLRIRGDTYVNEVLVFGPLKDLDAKDVELRGRVEIQESVSRIRFKRIAEDHRILIGNSDVSTVLSLGEVADLTIDSGSPIASLAATTWHDTDDRPDRIRARSLGKLSIKGDFPASLELDGELGRASVKGALHGGHWQVGAGAGNITAGSITADWSGTFAGPVRRLSVKGDAAGNVTALSIGRVTIKGDFNGGASGAVVRLTQPVDASKPKKKTLGKLTVSGVVRNVEIHSAGHVGTITARAMHDSRILVGVKEGVLEMPSDGDFVGDPAAKFDGLKLRGSRTLTFWLQNTIIAAPRIGSAKIGFVRTQNAGMPFGITTGWIKSITYKDVNGTDRAKTPQDIAARFPVDDFEVRLV